MAQKRVIEIEAKADKALGELEALKKELQDLNKEVVSSNKNTEESLKGIESATKTTAKGFKGVGLALKAAGIGIAIELFTKFKELLGQNQVVVDAFNTAFGAMSIVVNDFVSFVTNNFGKVVDYFKAVFEDPKQSLIDFGNAVKANLIERFNSFLDTLGYLASAVKKVFSGDFAGALDDVKNAGKEYIDVFTGVDGTFDKVVDGVSKATKAAVEYGKKVIQTSAANVELAKSSEIAAVQQQGLIEKYDRQAEKLRQVRDEERNSIDDRIKANNELKAVLDEQEAAMLALVDTQIAAAQAAYDANNTQENYIALLQATQEKEAVLAQIEGFRSEQKINDLGLAREKIDLTQSEIEAENTRLIEGKKANAELIQSDVARLEAMKAILQEEKVLEEKRLKDKIALYEQGTQARQDAENELQDFLAANGQAQTKIDQDVAQAKMDSVMTGLSGVAKLVGESSGFGKAIAVTQAIIDTYAGANKALAQGGIFGGIAAAGIIAGGLANVRNITATQTPAPPSFASEAKVSTPVASARPTPPSINVVGASGATQLADVVGASLDRPVKAYVVSKDVSTAQEFDRNVQSDASLG
jgi:hypothetical protein